MDILQLEILAERLRQCVRAPISPELKLLCGLQFFDHFHSDPVTRAEPYVREFGPALADAASHSTADKFLPDEAQSLHRLADLLRQQPTDLVNEADRQTIDRLDRDVANVLADVLAPAGARPLPRTDDITCLFVEHYPELGLEPRGRIIRLKVLGSSAPSGVKEDIVTVHNPVEQPDDRFLKQARQSVAVAREYLSRHNTLAGRARHRIDFALDSTGARFTGESLGVAFAVGAAAAISKTELLRDRLAVSPDVAFSGALAADGTIEPIDSRGLQLKIYRAFYSDLRYLVIPREHLTEGWEYLQTLEAQHPGRKLELMGADRFEAVVEDARLVTRTRLGWGEHAWRQVRKKGRSPWIEVPALVVLAGMLFTLVAPARWMPWFDRNPVQCSVYMKNNVIAFLNAAGEKVWTLEPSCSIADSLSQPQLVRFVDMDGDGRNEVLVMLSAREDCEERNKLYCYSNDGDLKFWRDCTIRGQYVNDTAGVCYDSEHLNVFVVDSMPMIVTNMFASFPARSHMRFWSTTGDSLGWFLNAGCSWPMLVRDHDHDGHDELLALCFNNRISRAALLAVHPIGSHGCSPPYSDSGMDITWVDRGNQIAYVAFPQTDVGERLSPRSYNQPGQEGIKSTDSILVAVNIGECGWRGFEATMIYYVDNRWRTVMTVSDDTFAKARDSLLGSGGLTSPQSLNDYLELVEESVSYWADSGWVTEGQLRTAGQ